MVKAVWTDVHQAGRGATDIMRAVKEVRVLHTKAVRALSHYELVKLRAC